MTRSTELILRVAAALLASASVALAAEPAPLDGHDLAALIAGALTSHPALDAAAQEQEAAAGRVRQVGSWPDPMVMWGEMIEGPSERMLSLTQSVPWPGTLGAREQAATAMQHAAGWRREATAVGVVAGVRRAWAHAAWLGETRTLLVAQRDLAAGLERSVRAAYEAGGGRYADLLQVQVEVARRDDQLARLQEDLAAARSRLNAALGRDAQAPLAMPATLAGAAEAAAEAAGALMASDGGAPHPSLEVFARRADAARWERQAASRAGRPVLSLGVDWIRMDGSGMAGGDETSDRVRAKLGFNLPLWRGKVDGAMQAAAAAARVAEAEREALRQALDARVETALASWRDAGRRRDLYTGELLPLARQAYETVLASYRAGGAAFADVLAAQRTLLDLELSLLAARRDLAVAAADLDEARGRVPAALDPAARSGS